MEFDYHKAVLLIFAIGIFGCLAGIFLLSFRKHSPERKKKAEELIEKQEAYKRQLSENYIRQVHALNVMLESGAISSLDYDIKRADVLYYLKKFDIDATVINSIPKPQAKDVKGMIKKKMIISTQLNDTGQMDDDELNDNINKSLDELNDCPF